jgi:ferredoxin
VTFVITEKCLGVKDASCVATCPVDCIIGTPDDPMMFIDPALCIDCAACAPVCPVKAIYAEAEVPPEQAQLIAINRQYFCDRANALEQLRSRDSR